MRGTVKQLNRGSKINAIILSKLPLFYFSALLFTWCRNTKTPQTQSFAVYLRMKYLLILLLLSCSTSVHQYNLDNQRKTMLKYDRKSIRKQQNIRDRRSKTLFRININKNKKIIIK